MFIETKVGKCCIYIFLQLCYSCWETLGAEKENESCIFKSVEANGDLIDSVLATLVENKVVPDPFYGLQNETIIDIADSGREYYTVWFFTTFQSKLVRNLLTWNMFLRFYTYWNDFHVNFFETVRFPLVAFLINSTWQCLFLPTFCELFSCNLSVLG